MALGVTAEQEELRDSVHRFLTDRAPLTKVRELMETEDGLDRSVWEQVGAQLGLLGLAIPEEYGGAGFTFAEQAIVLEELGAALYGGPFFASAVLAANALLASPSPRSPSPRTTATGTRPGCGWPRPRTARAGASTGTRASCSTAAPPT
jgi:alkylation response protein AidB-like acyl-CoA dehydrogenase